jgi:hypothetical protein
MFFTGMMHQDNGGVIGALDFPHVSKQIRDVSRAVFIEAMEANQGIEQ